MALSTDTLGPYDVRSDDLRRIGPDQAIDLFRQLLVIEAGKVGIPVTGVNVPSAINVADGGIDADVAGVAIAELPAGLLSDGLTCYQIKTGAFSASTYGEIRSLLVQPKFAKGKKPVKKEQLQPRVLSCFENCGAFVVVLFGTELVGKADDHGPKQISEFMATIDPAFANIEVRILRANQLCSAIKVLAPAIALRLNRLQGQDQAVFHGLAFMAESCELRIDVYHPTDELAKAAEQITLAADSATGFQHVRVLGDAGAGKTHLIFRALNESQLRGCVLYCPDPEQALRSVPIMELREMSQRTAIILVADDCNIDNAQSLAALFKTLAVKMLLVTADNVAEHAGAHANTEVVDVPRLGQPVIADIFKGYDIPSDSASWLASLCEGSPRAAHQLGQYIQRNPEQQPSQHLAHLDDLWDQVVCAPDGISSDLGQEKLAVARTLALFHQVGWDTGDGPTVQKDVLAALRRVDQAFSPHSLSRAVGDLRRRRVLQGPRTLMISPKLLHVAMWKGWFDKYSPMVEVHELREALSARMKQHFDAMLMFVQESKAATAWAEQLMGEGGIFASLAGYSTPSGASLFFAVAQAKPKAALRRFAAALEHEEVQTRKEFAGDARRTAVHRLEQLAIPAETFLEAAQCLLLLAEAENETWSNNSTGVFVSLFGLGHGDVAASELSPVGKIDYLRGLLRSEIPFRRSIAIQALSKSLDPFMSRTVIEEVVGLRRLPGRWSPKTWGELYEAYEAHLTLLQEAIDSLPATEADAAANGILSYVRSLIQIGPLSKKILAFLRHAAKMPRLRERCIEVIVATLHYEGKALPGDVKTELDAIQAELTQSSFTNRLRRHAGMKLIEDNFDAEGNHSDAAAPELLQLAEQALADSSSLDPELTWLVTDEAKNGFQFGQLLGETDDLKLWSAISSAWIKAGTQRSDYFVGGYLAALHAKSTKTWERIVEALFAIAEVRAAVPSIVWRSGMSDRIARAMLEWAKQGELDPKRFQLFIYGGSINQFPLDALKGIIDLLQGSDDPNAPVAAVEILDSRVRAHPHELDTLAPRIEHTLNAKEFIEGDANRQSNNMMLFRWNALANRLLDCDPDAGAKLAVRCIAHFANDESVTDGYDPESLDFLFKAAKARPNVVWGAISNRLETRSSESTTWQMLRWLRGGRSMHHGGRSGLDAFPIATVFEWIGVDVARASLLAEQCPPAVSGQGEPPSFSRQLLERYGSHQQVRRNLLLNSYTESWSGLASSHYRQRLAVVDVQLEVESNANVRTWLTEQREQLERSIEFETERELRESEH